jgi:hypothetical protein
VVTPYRRFETTYRSHLQRSINSIPSWPLEIRPIGGSETSIRKYHYLLRNVPEESSSEYIQFKNVPVNCVRNGLCKSESAQYLYGLKLWIYV